MSTRIMWGLSVECAACRTVQASITLQWGVGQVGVGDCDPCHGLGVIRSLMRSHFRMWFQGQTTICPTQFPRVRRHSMKWADWCAKNKSQCMIRTRWWTMVKLHFGVAPGVIRRHPEIGSGQVTRNVDARQQVRSVGRHRDSHNAGIHRITPKGWRTPEVGGRPEHCR